jgi:hypothetical protein
MRTKEECYRGAASDRRRSIVDNPVLVDRTQIRQLTAFFRMQGLDVLNETGHDGPHLLGEHAAHPIEPPSTTLAALRMLAMATAMAALRALPARPMTARSGAPNRRI